MSFQNLWTRKRRLSFRSCGKPPRLRSAKGPRNPGLHSDPFSSLSNPLNPEAKVYASYAQNRTPGAYRMSSVMGPGV